MTHARAVPTAGLHSDMVVHVEHHEGIRVRCSGSGPHLVLLHGNAGSWTHWIRNIPALSATHRVVAFDLPGFGGSPDVPDGMDIEGYIAWVAEALLSATRDRFAVAGFSFGASVAAATAPLLGTRLDRMSLAAPGGFGVPRDRNVTILPVRKEARHGEARKRAAAAQNLRELMIGDTSRIDDQAIDLYLDNIEHARFDGRKLSWLDRIERDLAAFSAPLHLLWGDLDRLSVPSIEARIDICKAVRPDARTDIIRDAAHWVQYEQADPYNACLSAFLRDASPVAHNELAA